MTLNEKILRAIASGALLSATFGCQPTVPDADPSQKALGNTANEVVETSEQDLTNEAQDQNLMAEPDEQNTTSESESKTAREPGDKVVPDLNDQNGNSGEVSTSPATELPGCASSFTEEELKSALSGKHVQKGEGMLICKATCAELPRSKNVNGGYQQVCGPWEMADGCCHTQVYIERRRYRGRPFMVEGVARTGLLDETDAWASQLSLNCSLTPDQRRVVAESWAQAGAEEHASIASFSQFLLDLMSLGAPPRLIQDTAKAINDEVLHAQACFGIASALAENPVGPGPLDVSQPQVLRTPEDILRAAIREGCIGETLAAHLAGWLAPKAEHRTVRGVLEGIVDDEGEHAALAWEFVAWMLASRPHLRAVALEEYEALQHSPAGIVDEAGELVAWGVATEAVEAQLFSRAVNEVLVPAFDALLA